MPASDPEAPWYAPGSDIPTTPIRSQKRSRAVLLRFSSINYRLVFYLRIARSSCYRARRVGYRRAWRYIEDDLSGVADRLLHESGEFADGDVLTHPDIDDFLVSIFLHQEPAGVD